MFDGRPKMTSKIKKFWRKKREVRYTFMLVPRASGVTKSINIPFFIIVFFLFLLIANIYFLARYPLRLSEIDQLNDVITRNDNDLRVIDPSIKKTEEFEATVKKQGEIIKQIEALHKSILEKKAGKI